MTLSSFFPRTALLVSVVALSSLTACGGGGGGGGASTPDDGNQDNSAPNITGENFSGLTFAREVVLTNVEYSDVDDDLTMDDVTVTQAPEYGSLSLSPTGSGENVIYTPQSLDALTEGDRFTLAVSDGDKTDTGEFTIAFDDDSGPVVKITPEDGADGVDLMPGIAFESDDPIDPATLSYNSSDGACTGTLQVSDDNFSSCLGISSVSLSTLGFDGDVSLAQPLVIETQYKIKITTGLTNYFALPLAGERVSSFTSRENLPPVINDQSVSGLVFSDSVPFSVDYSDPDESDDLTVSVVSAPSHGSVTVGSNNALSYQPSSAESISGGDSFTLQVSDGDKVDTAEITVAFSRRDVVSNAVITPMNEDDTVALQPSVSLQYQEPLDTSTLSYQSVSGNCSNFSVQVKLTADTSGNNCIGIDSASFSSLDRVLTLTLDEELVGNAEYSVDVADLEDRYGQMVNVDSTHNFTTAVSELMITEVSAPPFLNSSRWVEIVNPTSSPLDLSDYALKSHRYLDDATDGVIENAHAFALPAHTVSPGEYVVLRAQTMTPNGSATVPELPSTDRVVYLKDGDLLPFWSNYGALELVKYSNGSTADFVTFGITYTPVTRGAWTGSSAPALPSSSLSDYGTGIVRTGNPFDDSNSNSDWDTTEWLTAGGPNDVSCTDDLDEDGIPDCSEVAGSTFAGLPLYDWGARQGRKDIFVEVDYMDPTDGGSQPADEGIRPRREALDNVVAAFASQSIAVHFDVGDLFDNAPGTDPADYDLGGGEEVPFAIGVSLDSSSSLTDLYDYKNAYMDYSRLQAFHYLLMGNSQNASGTIGPSGRAEINGNDLLVSLGEWGLNSSSSANTNMLINFQAGTIMHELGHNLGLRHGGDEIQNYKPNYLSIMNYLYQLEGLSTIGNDEGDRYYLENFGQGASCFTGMSNPNTSTNMVIDFSDGMAVDIDLSALDETTGLGRVNSSSVDYNCNGNDSESGVSVEVDASNGGFSGVSSDYNDWGNIDLVFQRTFSGHNSGDEAHKRSDELRLMPTTVGNDRSPVAREWAPSQAFIQRLQRKTGQQEAPAQ